MPNELRPCPFCGAIPTLVYEDNFKKWWIACNNDKCMIQPFTSLHINKGVIVREWNRRVDNGCIY